MPSTHVKIQEGVVTACKHDPYEAEAGDSCDLHKEFQGSQSCTLRPCLYKRKKTLYVKVITTPDKSDSSSRLHSRFIHTSKQGNENSSLK